MQASQVIEESLRLGEFGRLSGVLHYPPEASPTCAVLLCSPHPNFAGDMDNNVIRSLARRLSEEFIVLRFDYRGVGASEIALPQGESVFDFWDQVEQTRDYAGALEDTRDAADALHRLSDALPMVAVGYSFGSVTGLTAAMSDTRFIAAVGIAPPYLRIAFDFLARCPKPCLMLSGDADFVYDANTAATLAAIGGGNLRLEQLAGMDHFFRGQESLLAERVVSFARGIMAGPGRL
jgi:alpha/beta superfamily hydrolase